MSEFSASVAKWISERPKWLQAAAICVLEQNEISESNFLKLVSLCQEEAIGKLSHADPSFPTTAFSPSTSGSLRLCAISDIEGVNTLAPRNPLKFGKSNISIVYGCNGSGKSGYVRLLKHICGARNPGTLYRNVYAVSQNTQKATITFDKDGTTISHDWVGQGICDDLKSVDIFDTSFGRVFVNNEDEVCYEPPVLSFFSTLIEICEKVAGALDSEANRHQSKKPNMSVELKLTAEGVWYDGINGKTTSQDIDKHCSFGSEDEAEVQNLQQRLAEQAPAEKAKQLKKQKSHVDSLIQDAKKCFEELSDKNCRLIIAAKMKSIAKKTAADISAERVFSGSHLEGIGSNVWKELWEAARNYSVSAAYKELDYPNVSEDSRCILCHQTLTQDAKERLVSFESFVKGEMQRVATEASSEYEAALQTVENIPALDSIKARIDASGIQQEAIMSQIMEFFSQMQTRKAQLPLFESEEAIPILPQPPRWIEEADSLSKHLGGLAEKYEEDAKNDNRNEIKEKFNNLVAKKWLSEHRTAIQEEIDRLKLFGQIQNAKKTANTKALSQKKGELAETLITDAFVRRFNAELRLLGAAQVKVELVKSKVSKGRVLHKLQLTGAANHSLPDVLSEGENRIVSIAAFLADVTGKNSQTPFIFDDPISSLDQTYEEAVVKRLIDISQHRQVIVFTHRLSLLGTVRHFAEKKSMKPDVISIRSTDWGTGEPAPIPLSQSEIKSALNTLMSQRYQDAKNASDDGKFEHAEILLKSICSDFRTLVERSIENDLLCGVVQRFQRPVHTLKLKDLSKLKDSDCTLLDSLMTKYSGFEHSQPLESPIELPKPDDLLADMTALKDWREEYSKRGSTTGA